MLIGWQFMVLKWIWGKWSPSDMLLIGTYAGTPFARTLPWRQRLVCALVGHKMCRAMQNTTD